MSDSGEVPIKIDLFGIGTSEGILIRHLAPLTADAIIEKLPLVLRGRFGFGGKKYWTLPGLGIRKGANPKSTKNVKKGDIVYNPMSDELIFILEDDALANRVNVVGKVSKNLSIFFNARNGLNTKISKIT